MKEPNVFTFESHTVRTVLDENGEPLFNANDVCAVLDLANPWDAIARHVDPEDLVKHEALSAGGPQLQNHVNESGLYALIFGSTKETAKRFKRWVTSEVLPTIRRTGHYELRPEADNDAQTLPLVRRTRRMDCAARLFTSYLRVGRHLSLVPARAVKAANAIAKEETGVDVLARMRVAPEELTSAAELVDLWSDPVTLLPRLSAWLGDRPEVNVGEIINGMGFAVTHARINEALIRIDALMAALGWGKGYHPRSGWKAGYPVYLRPVVIEKEAA